MKNFLLFLSIISTLTLFAQNKNAENILKSATEKLNSYKTVEAEFKYELIDPDGNVNESGEGTLLVSGDKYRLNIVGQLVICDGETMWTYIKDAEEVQIYEVIEDEDVISPSKLLTFYNKNYKAKSLKEETIEGSDVYIVGLKPNEDKNYYNADLYIRKDNLHIMKVVLDDKNGGQTIYKIKEFIPEKEVEKGIFTFDESDYPNVDIIDMR